MLSELCLRFCSLRIKIKKPKKNKTCQPILKTLPDGGSTPPISTLRLSVKPRGFEVAQPHLNNYPLKTPPKSVPNVARRAKWGYIIMLVYYTYILQLSDSTFYTGFSADLKQRITAHHNGLVSQTKNHRPIELIYYSSFLSKQKALDFEKYLKTYSGFAFRNKRLV